MKTNPTNFLQIFSTATVCFLFLLPVLAAAQGGFIPCQGTVEDPCDYEDLLKMIQNIIDWIILVSFPVAAGIFAWAGFKYMTTGLVDQKAAAKSMMTKVFWGFVFILSAYLIVDTILKALT